MSLNNLSHGTHELTGATEEEVALPVGSTGGFLLQAHPNNAANMLLGSDGLTNDGSATDGIVLVPGASVPIDLYNPGDLRVIGTIGDKLAWLALTS